MEVYLAKCNTTGIIGVYIDNETTLTVVNPKDTAIVDNVSYFITLNRKFPDDMITGASYTAVKCESLNVRTADELYNVITNAIGVMCPVYTPQALKDLFALIKKCQVSSKDKETEAFFDCIQSTVGMTFDYSKVTGVTDITKLKEEILKVATINETVEEVDFNEGEVW